MLHHSMILCRLVHRLRPGEEDHRDQPVSSGDDGRRRRRLHVLGARPLKAMPALRTQKQGENQRGCRLKTPLQHLFQLQRYTRPERKKN